MPVRSPYKTIKLYSKHISNEVLIGSFVVNREENLKESSHSVCMVQVHVEEELHGVVSKLLQNLKAIAQYIQGLTGSNKMLHR